MLKFSHLLLKHPRLDVPFSKARRDPLADGRASKPMFDFRNTSKLHPPDSSQRCHTALVGSEHVLNQDKKEKSDFGRGVKQRDCLGDYLQSPLLQEAILNNKRTDKNRQVLSIKSCLVDCIRAPSSDLP